jgi:pimeloyl-ACP methyl ester carboxylesterase
MGNSYGNRARMPAMTTRTRMPATVPEKRTWKLRPMLRLLSFCGRVFPRATGRFALRYFMRPRRKIHAPEEMRALRAAKEHPCLPFHSRRTREEKGGTSLQCYVWGAGPRTVLLVHGWESHAGRLTPLVAPLVAAGFRVVAFDGPAHGDSDGRSTDLPDFAHAIGTVREHFGPFYAVLAHSFGGASSLWYLSEHPDDAVERLVLFGAPSGVRFMLGVFIERLQLSSAVREIMAEGIGRRYTCALEDLDLPARIGSVSVPTLLIHDRNDNLVPFTEGESLHRALPNATLHATDGLWHSATLRDPEVHQRILAFLHA